MQIKRICVCILVMSLLISAVACQSTKTEKQPEESSGAEEESANSVSDELDDITVGTETYNGFIIDNIFHSETEGDIHYHVYFPKSYDGSKPYAAFFTLPGYEGLYFQGVAQNLKSEAFGFEAQKYVDDMIIVAPQLNDWGNTSASQTIALVDYFLSAYNIDPERVYANGYSGGGETMSLVLEKRPELFCAYLHCSSRWDGDCEALVNNKLPVYLAVGESDEYYGSEPTQEAYRIIHDLYEKQGLSEDEIARLIVMDIKDAAYFHEQGIHNQHTGGLSFAYDEDIMSWLFKH